MSQENKIVLENPILAKALEANAAAEKKETDKLSSLRDRLMRRTKRSMVTIDLEDDAGKFQIRCRLFTEAEQRKMMQYQDVSRRIQGNSGEYPKAMRMIYEILAYPDGACLDPELDMEYWEGLNYSSDLPILIITRIGEKTREIISGASLFRPK